MKHFFKPLAKSVLIPLGLTAAASPANAGMHKKFFGSGMRSTNYAQQSILIISNKEMDSFIKIVKCLEKFGSSIKCVRKTI